VDGIIMSPIDSDGETIDLLARHKVETVFIDCLPRLRNQCYIFTDQTRGIQLAVEYVIKNGHRGILLMVCRQDAQICDLFVRTYQRLHGEYNLRSVRERIVYTDQLSIESGYRTFKNILTRNLLGKNIDFTAIVTMNDLLAIGIYKAANELGMDIPGNFSVIGYDDIEMSSALNPPLTTVHQSRRRIGAESVKRLLSNIEAPKKNRGNVVFDPFIVRRGSVKNIK
jgi:DNA-binding LacI/PurR family transcriptional regulator